MKPPSPSIRSNLQESAVVAKQILMHPLESNQLVEAGNRQDASTSRGLSESSFSYPTFADQAKK
jgi:hypothetical protein